MIKMIKKKEIKTIHNMKALLLNFMYISKFSVLIILFLPLSNTWAQYEGIEPIAYGIVALSILTPTEIGVAINNTEDHYFWGWGLQFPISVKKSPDFLTYLYSNNHNFILNLYKLNADLLFRTGYRYKSKHFLVGFGVLRNFQSNPKMLFSPEFALTLHKFLQILPNYVVCMNISSIFLRKSSILKQYPGLDTLGGM